MVRINLKNYLKYKNLVGKKIDCDRIFVDIPVIPDLDEIQEDNAFSDINTST